MTTIALNNETSRYWEQLKGASEQVKLSLISLLSASLLNQRTEKQAKEKTNKPFISRKDLELTPFVASIGSKITPLSADFDYQKSKEEYLLNKYGR